MEGNETRIKSDEMKNQERNRNRVAQLFRNPPLGKRLSPFTRLFKSVGWWFGFTGLYAGFTVCPVCGRPGCPVGMTSAGAIGAFFALVLNGWKRFKIKDTSNCQRVFINRRCIKWEKYNREFKAETKTRQRR